MIPILLDDTKNLTNLVSDNSNGLGKLSEVIDATVIEARNGEYDLTFRIPMNAKHFSDIHNGGIVRVKASEISGNQMFRIYKITKPINGIVTVECHHITYDLNKVAVKPFSATGAVNTVNGMIQNTIGTYPFTFTTNLTNATSKFTMTEPMSFRGALGGYQGSILDVFGGEYRFNNLAVELLSSRGSDNGVTIRYGKNLIDLNQEENIDNTYSAVVGYATVDETTRVSDLQTATQMTYPKVKIVDFSSDYETLPTKAQLNTKVRQYIQNNDIGKPNVNLEVSFVALWQTEEYKNIAPLERVSLCDTVTVEFPRLGVSSKSKVVRTEWDVINERYISIELGDSRSNFAETISDNIQEEVEKNTTSWIDEAVNNATELITGGLGGYVVISRNANGEPEEILIMDQPTKESAVNVIRMNKNGIGFSTTGYTGPFTSAWTIDGAFVADFITSGTLRAINIEGVSISGSNLRFGSDPYVQVQTNSYQKGVLFRGTGTVNFDTNNSFSVVNRASNSNLSNQFTIENDTTQSYIYLFNYYEGISTNSLSMIGRNTYNSTTLYNKYPGIGGDIANSLLLTSDSSSSNSLGIYNNKFLDRSKTGNRLYMRSQSSDNAFFLWNYNYGETNNNLANTIRCYSQSNGNGIEIENFDSSGVKVNGLNLLANGMEILNYSSGSLKNTLVLTPSKTELGNYTSGTLHQRLTMDSNGTMLSNDNGGSCYIWLKNDGTIDIYGSAVRIYNQQ